MSERVLERVVELHIETMTIDGVNVPSRARLVEAITRELEARIGSSAHLFAEDLELERVDGGELPGLQHRGSRAIGEEIAGGVDRALRASAGEVGRTSESLARRASPEHLDQAARAAPEKAGRSTKTAP